MATVLVELPIELLIVGDNVRSQLGELDGLAASIGTAGILAPLLVEELGDETYRVIAGHRRLSASVQSGLARVPCRVVQGPLDEAERLALMLQENLHREELPPLDEARAYRRLIDLGHTQRSIAALVKCSQSQVSRRLSLLELTLADQERLAAGTLAIEQALDRAKGSIPPPSPAPRPRMPSVRPESAPEAGDGEVPQLVVTLTEKEHARLTAAARRVNARPEALVRRLVQQYLQAVAA